MNVEPLADEVDGITVNTIKSGLQITKWQLLVVLSLKIMVNIIIELFLLPQKAIPCFMIKDISSDGTRRPVFYCRR